MRDSPWVSIHACRTRSSHFRPAEAQDVPWACYIYVGTATTLREHAPEEYRETMIAHNPLHRRIAAVGAERGRTDP